MSQNGPALRDALRDFVSSHPDGWGHPDWEALLDDLRRKALDATDESAIGATLEREKLLAKLERTGVRGVGPKRRAAIAESYGRLWDLQQASPEELARSSGIPQPMAEELLRALRS
jgi:hypothetical protein